MIIIEGKVGKSLEVNKQLKDAGDVVVINYTDRKLCFLPNPHYLCSKGEEMTVESAVDDYIKAEESFERFDTVVFYTDAPVSLISDFKKLDSLYNQNFIVTFQNNEIEEALARII